MAGDLRLGCRWLLCFFLGGFVASGCGAAPRADDPWRWVQLGVDREQMSARVEASLVEAGFSRQQRVAGRQFTALAFRHRDGRTAVRVITRRGIVTALDYAEADPLASQRGWIALLDDPPTMDIDGDGHEEVWLRRNDPRGEGACLAALRVDDAGRASVIGMARAEIQPEACPARLADVDGDGEVELLAALRWPAPTSDARGAEVWAVLRVMAGRFELEMPASYLETERVRRREALGPARAREDLSETLRLALELAALSALQGALPTAQVRAFEEALPSPVPAQAASRVGELTRLIAHGWR